MNFKQSELPEVYAVLNEDHFPNIAVIIRETTEKQYNALRKNGYAIEEALLMSSVHSSHTAYKMAIMTFFAMFSENDTDTNQDPKARMRAILKRIK